MYVIYNKDDKTYLKGHDEWTQDIEDAMVFSAQGARILKILLSVQLGQECIVKKVKETNEDQES